MKVFHTDPSELCDFDRDRFDLQVSKLLEVHWQTLPIPETMSELDSLEKLLPDDSEEAEYTPRKAFEAIRAMVKKSPPQYSLGTTSGWGQLNALLSWLHDGTKAQRPFEAWRAGRWESGKAFNKDSLNGKEEAVFRVTAKEEKALQSFCKQSLGMSKGTFKLGEQLGASTLIKRLWHKTFLASREGLGITELQFRTAMPMPNTHSIAAGKPFAQEKDGSDEDDGTDSTEKSKKHYAILALDGDEMGKWISGSKSPEQRCPTLES